MNVNRVLNDLKQTYADLAVAIRVLEKIAGPVRQKAMIAKVKQAVKQVEGAPTTDTLALAVLKAGGKMTSQQVTKQLRADGHTIHGASVGAAIGRNARWGRAKKVPGPGGFWRAL